MWLYIKVSNCRRQDAFAFSFLMGLDSPDVLDSLDSLGDSVALAGGASEEAADFSAGGLPYEYPSLYHPPPFN